MNYLMWRMKDGKEILITEMTTSHIKNCINALEEGRIRRLYNLGWETDNDYQIIEEDTEWADNWIGIFKNELKRRGVEE